MYKSLYYFIYQKLFKKKTFFFCDLLVIKINLILNDKVIGKGTSALIHISVIRDHYSIIPKWEEEFRDREDFFFPLC